MSTEPAQPASGIDRTLRRVLVFFAVILAVLVFVVAASLYNLNRSIATSDWVNHTHALINELDALQPALVAAEGELNKFLLTSDSRDHSAYQEKLAELDEHSAVLSALITNDAHQESFLPITDMIARRTAHAEDIATAKKAGDTAALSQLLATDAERNDHRELGRRITKFREIQTSLLSERDRSSYLQAQVTRWTVLGGVFLDFLLLCGAAWLIQDDLAARRIAARLLQQTNAELEAKVAERTAQLTAANVQLVAQNLEERWSKQAIEHQNRYNLLIIDSISDAVFVVTKLVNVSRLNPAAIHLTGYEPVDLVDKPLAHYVQLITSQRGAVPPAFDLLARTLIEGHELRDRPATITTKAGHAITVRLNLFPLRDRDKVVGGVLILQALPLTP